MAKPPRPSYPLVEKERRRTEMLRIIMAVAALTMAINGLLYWFFIV